MKWFSSHTSIKSYLLVGVKLMEGKQLFRYAIIRKSERNLPLYEEVDSLEEIFKKVGGSIPVVLHVTGFGVLARITEKLPNYRDSLIISGDKDEFYFNSIEFNNSMAVSFLRKNLLSDLLEELNRLKFYLFGIHLGPIALLLNAEKNQTINLDYTIKIINGDVITIDRVDTDKSDFFVSEKYLKAFSDVCFYQGEDYQQSLSDTDLKNVKSNFKEYKRFVRLGLFILSFFLFTLTGNYFYVNHLNQTAVNLEADISTFGQNLSIIDRLNQEKRRKLILADNSGVQGKTFLTYYLDKIGASIPSTINLEELTVFPLIDNLKPKMKVEIETKKIVIHGF